MKANEAPEKIYMSPAGVLYKGGKQQCNDIEYARTDTFIEKAISYIQQHWIWNTKMIEEFRKYMEGE